MTTNDPIAPCADAQAVTLPPVSTGDLDAVAGLVAEVRWPHRRVDIEALIALGRGRMLRDASDGTVLGTGLWWPFGTDLARLGMIIVSPTCQGRGLGRHMVERLLADAAPRSIMLLATRAGRPLYEKLGFVDTGVRIAQHQGEFHGRPRQDSRVRPAGPADRRAIAELDRAAFGADRMTVLDRLLSVGRTAVLVEGGRVAGYALERTFGRGTTIGPVVADSEDAAITLFDALARSGFLRVDLPATATRFASHVDACGLSFDSESPAMLRGDWPAPTGAPRMFALASHALG